MKVRIIDSADATEVGFTALYIRVTKEESVATDLSIPNQRSRGVEVCGERGWPTVKIYIEPKHVGGDVLPAKRPALAELLRDIEAGRVTRVLVRHTDRLWRGTRVQDLIMETLSHAGSELWDFGGLREQKSAGGRFALKVLGAAAELEKGLTGERIREMKRGKAKAGKLAGGPPPYGYTSQSRIKRESIASGMDEDSAEREAVGRCPLPRALYPDEQEAIVVCLIFEMYVQHGMGCRRIAFELTRLGYRRRGGYFWVAVKVAKVVNNPVVAGFTSYDEEAYAKGVPSTRPRFRQTLYPGVHPPLVSPEIWKEAQRIKTEIHLPKRRTKSASSARIYCLTGILTCGQCGSPMRGRSRGAKNGGYVCSRRAYLGEVHGCAAPSMNQEWAEVTFWNYIEGLFQSPDVVARVVEEVNKKTSHAEPEARKRLEAARVELASLQAKQRKWMTRLEECDDVDTSLIWRRIKELEERRVVIDEEVKAVEQHLPRNRDRRFSTDEVMRAFKKLGEGAAGSPEKRRFLADRLVLRHDLRIRVLEGHRLAISLRLNPVDDAPNRAMTPRVVIATRKGAAGPQRAGGRPMDPRSPVPGGPTSKRL